MPGLDIHAGILAALAAHNIAPTAVAGTSAGALIGVNTVGQSLRNANYQLRSEPPNPQVPVTVFNIPTIEPDMNRRALEIA
jgi:predicted acylesterase/phospholipase RssA